MTTTTGGRILCEIIQNPMSSFPKLELNLLERVNKNSMNIENPHTKTIFKSIPCFATKNTPIIKSKRKNIIDAILGR